MFIDWYKSKLDEIGTLNADERMILAFLPIDKSKADLSEISISDFFKFLRSVPANLDPSLIK